MNWSNNSENKQMKTKHTRRKLNHDDNVNINTGTKTMRYELYVQPVSSLNQNWMNYNYELRN